jgi:hypothetical protein
MRILHLMLAWKFSFTMAIGIDHIMGTGIEREVIMGHGVMSKKQGCPMY